MAAALDDVHVSGVDQQVLDASDGRLLDLCAGDDGDDLGCLAERRLEVRSRDGHFLERLFAEAVRGQGVGCRRGLCCRLRGVGEGQHAAGHHADVNYSVHTAESAVCLACKPPEAEGARPVQVSLSVHN